MSKFRITTAWASLDGENPWLLSAYDEYTEDAWNGTPDFFTKALADVGDGAATRIVDLYVDYNAIEERFSAIDVDAEVGEER